MKITTKEEKSKTTFTVSIEPHYRKPSDRVKHKASDVVAVLREKYNLEGFVFSAEDSSKSISNFNNNSTGTYVFTKPTHQARTNTADVVESDLKLVSKNTSKQSKSKTSRKRKKTITREV
tara:strand:- start:1578 stop:1937 length:360 start_codon:yes stop_codon:yes gene_type:complete